MRQTILMFSFLVITISCGERKISFDELDFMAYSYRLKEATIIEIKEQLQIICPIYLHIDNQRNAQIIYESSEQSKKTIKFIWNSKDPELEQIVKEIILKSKHLSYITDLMPPPETIYDGYDLVIRITNNHKYKIIKFPERHDSSNTYEELYRYAIKMSKINMDNNDSYLSKVDKRKQQFIQFILKVDSIYNP
jgi:hypothetical protein